MTSDPIEILLELARAEPLPAAHVSSHWQGFGGETVVRSVSTGLEVRASGFETVGRMGAAGRALAVAERWSYRSALRAIRSFDRVWGEAERLAHDLGADPNFNVLKSACALATLADHWDEHSLRPTTFVMIGDGFGFFGALVRRCRPDSRVYCIDLPKQLVIQADTHRRADPSLRDAVLTSGPDVRADVLYVPPDNMETIAGPIDCAVNIASMQEMTPNSISGYFGFLRRRSDAGSRFYCVNRESKTLPDGSVIRFAEYPWSPWDQVFIDGACPYYTHYLSRYTARTGPRLLGVRIPLVNWFDGRHLHRLVRLSSS